MRVKMIKSTFDVILGRLQPRQELEVDNSIGARWVRNGIARELIVYEAPKKVEPIKQAPIKEKVVELTPKVEPIVEKIVEVKQEDVKQEVEEEISEDIIEKTEEEIDYESMTRPELMKIVASLDILVEKGDTRNKLIEKIRSYHSEV